MTCYVVAEAGLNHNGSMPRLMDMVRTAKSAGCDAFKIQAYSADEFVGPDATYTYQERDGHGGMRSVTEKQSEMFHRCELTFEQVRAVKAECVRLQIALVVTATDAEWIEKLKRLGVMFKVGSDDIIHLPLLRTLAEARVPVVLSTGMASEAEVAAALEVVTPSALLHCVSLYPTPPDKANLLRMMQLKKFGIPVGFSDHTEGAMVATMAASMGAVMIEKHFTLDRNLPGPDHWFSADPEDLRMLCRFVKGVVGVHGTGTFDLSAEEEDMRLIARRSVVAKRDLPAGTALATSMLAYRRPGIGLPPSEGPLLVGRITRRALKAGECITPGCLVDYLIDKEVVH